MRQKSKSESVQEYPDQVLLDAILIYGLEGALMQARDAVDGVALWPLSESARTMYRAFLERHRK